MPQREILGKRPPTYSVWHRSESIGRYFHGGEYVARRLTMIDLDAVYVEAKHPYDRPPVALMETAQAFDPLDDRSTLRKQAGITYQLGKAGNIPVFKVMYLASDKPNPANPNYPDIAEFAIQQLYPIQDKLCSVMSPGEYVEWLVWLRQEHLRVKKNGGQLPLPSDLTMEKNELMNRWQFVISKRLGSR